LDPFSGSGTTSLSARNLLRNSVGYEINEEFVEISKQKLNINQADISGTEYQFLKEDINISFQKEIEKLPYVFTDVHKLDKKVDPKKLQFGSKIDKDGSSKRDELYTVKEVISPELLKLNNDLIVRLIGVKENKEYSKEAIEYLINKIKGQKVFIKFDNTKYDGNNNLLCYLYLKNKTFVNAHLVKSGLATVDTSIEYKYKTKFSNLSV